MNPSPLIADLEEYIRASRPDLETAQAEDGSTLRIAEQGRLREDDAPRFHVHAEEGAVVLDWTWRLPLRDGLFESLRDFILAYVEEGIQNHGWEVPIVLSGGPLQGRRLTKRREDLVGRLMFARKGAAGSTAQQAFLYKWHLSRNEAGEYVCVYERSLAGDAVDEFIARGVKDTGPFVLIHDRA